MEFNENVNLKNLADFLENEIKEISERWGHFTITKIALEKAIAKSDITVEDAEKFAAIDAEVKSKKPIDVPRYIAKLSPEDKAIYDKSIDLEDKKRSLENAEKGLKEFEDFLSIATDLQKEVNLKLRKNSELNGTPIMYDKKPTSY